MAEAAGRHGVHMIRGLQVKGGFLDGLRVGFDQNLNCIIGGRGTGKTTVLEVLRWALDHMPDRGASPNLWRNIDKLIRANLGKGVVEVEIETDSGLRYRVRRGNDDAAIVMNSAGEPVEIDIGRVAFFLFAVSDGIAESTSVYRIDIDIAEDTVAPGRPRNLTAVPGNGAVALRWEAPSHPGSSAIVRYEVRHAAGDAVPPATAWESVGLTFTHPVTGLADGERHTFEVRAVNSSSPSEGTAAQVQDTPSATLTPSVSMEEEEVRVAEDAGTAVVTVSLDRPSGAALSVPWYTADDTAVSPDDYIGGQGSVTFAPGETRNTSSVRIVDDVLREDPVDGRHEQFLVLPSRGDGYRLKNGGEALSVVIEDNDGDGPVTRDDTRPPLLTQATVDGRTLVLTYDEALDGASVPAPGDFVVTAAGSTVNVHRVSVAGSTVTLTLATAVQAGQTVTLDYTPGANPTQDAAGNDAAALSGQTVTNNTGRPVLTGATVNGSTLTLTYDKALDGASVPAASDFAVTAAGSTVNVHRVSVAGSTVTLTLATAVQAGETVTLDYTPGANPTQDAAGNDAVPLSGQTVTNNNGRPVLTGATVNGSTLTLTYDKALDGASVPAASDFAVTAAGSTVNVSGASVAGSTVTLTLATAVEAGQTVALDYTPGANPIQDAAGNDAAALSGQTVTNNTGRPVLTGATVNGSTLTLTYDKALDGASVPAASDFAVTAAGSTVNVSGARVAGSTVTLTLATAVEAGQTVALDYTPGANPIQDAAGNDAVPLSGQTVTNNTSGGGPITTPPGAPASLTTMPGDTRVVLTWSAPVDDGGSPVTGYEYRYAAGTSVPEDTPWQSAGLNLERTVAELTNGQQYAFEVRAMNSAGPGAAARTAATPLGVPTAPESLSAILGDGELELRWTAPADDGGAAVTGYEYRHAAGSLVPEDTPWQSAGLNLRWLISGLTNGQEYAFEVRAMNSAGPGAAARAAATPLGVPTTPESLTATARSSWSGRRLRTTAARP